MNDGEQNGPDALVGLMRVLSVDDRAEAFDAIGERFCFDCGAPEEEPYESKVGPATSRVLALVNDMPRVERVIAFEVVGTTFCTECAAELDEDGDCPEGCEPDDEDDDLDDDLDEEEENDDADA